MRADALTSRPVGWVLLPLRGFLGVTFTYAGLQKLANPDYLRASAPGSVQQQMQQLAHTSPLGPLLTLSSHFGVAVGLLIAVGELAVGLGTVFGLWARVAAVGGALLSLTFFLTVSWNTSPYYYGADIVFLFAWTPLLAVGAGGVLSVDGWLAERVRRDPRADPARRRLLLQVRAGLLLAGAGALAGGLTAVGGRLAGGTKRVLVGPRLVPPPSPTTPPHGSPPGTLIGRAGQVPVGQGAQFTDPVSGQPAWLVHPTGARFLAFSAVCTHAGCIVNYDPQGAQFVCPCHGGVYSGTTGQVLAGPPPRPLTPIPVTVADGDIYVQ